MDWIIQLTELAQQRPATAFVAYVLTYTAVMIVGLPGGIALLLLGGFLFGNLAGAVMALLGAALAAGITFPLARGLLGRALSRGAGEQRMAEIAGFVRRQGIFGLLIVRMIPLFPFALLNVGLSVTGVAWWPYILTTVIGTVPIALLVTRVGSQTQSIVQLEDAASLGAFLRPDILAPLMVLIALSGCGLWWRRRVAIRQAKDHRPTGVQPGTAKRG